MNAARELAAGQTWHYRAHDHNARSVIVIGAIVRFEERAPIVCCAVLNAPDRGQDGKAQATTIPFLPLAYDAAAQTLTEPSAQEFDLPEGFVPALQAWQEDARGLTCYTVPFDGRLDRMIALQMASIVETGQPA
ncbi:MAG: hypothetical protein AAFR04_00970 [Pseudomonadota bacterium]